ncbi:MAG: hypothetical protein LBI42_02905 [Chitinispirillales bacterium]|jgi:hypothetical protein|nr:hypothetical protein [Chitinispirillales bacterium]
MTPQLRNHLFDRYEIRRGKLAHRGSLRNTPIQIDDQDDNDSFTNFCNIFCIVEPSKNIRLELTGNFPINKAMADLAEIYKGFTDITRGKLVINITPDQIAVVTDLARLIRNTANMGSLVNNPHWFRIAARTSSSLMRFYRIVREFLEG